MNKFFVATVLLSFVLLLDFGSSMPQSESEDGPKGPPPNGPPPNGPPPNRPPPNGPPPNRPPPNAASGQSGGFMGRLHSAHKGPHSAGCKGSTTTPATTTTTAASG